MEAMKKERCSMVVSKKKSGKGKGSKAKKKAQEVQEVQNLVTQSAPPEPGLQASEPQGSESKASEPQAMPAGEVTDPQVSIETKEG
jgi:hypothetical protein